MRTLNVSLALGGIAFAISTQLSGCNAVSDDCETYATCPDGSSGSSGSGGTEGDSGAPGGGSEQGGQSGKGGSNASGSSGSSGDTGIGGQGGSGTTQCDTSKSPHDQPCLISDEFAVFVSPDGDDKNAGTQDAPFATLTKAVESAGDLAVLVCNATYDEHVTITNGARIFGGFECSDWTADVAKPLFKPSTPGPALKIDTVADVVLVDGVGFEVGDAVAAGATALTALVNASPKVTLTAVFLKAGKGKAGASGTLTNFAFPDKTTFKGNAESAAGEGGAGKTCACQATFSSTGGVGGTPIAGGQSGSKGQPDLGAGTGGDPAAGDCGSGSSGKKGADAPAKAPSAGATTLGSASPTGWEPSSGADGTTASPGQGGGGGASFNASGHGGGGGCGGCGGNGGTAGKGGGASVALLALSSPVSLQATSIVTSDAGDGGNGAAGQPGQKEAGGGGAVVDTTNSCIGGNGGFGGDGGAGGGGAGGVSAGVLWKGAAQPTVSADTTITNGKAGAKGIGGTPGTNDGIAGVVQKVLKAE